MEKYSEKVGPYLNTTPRLDDAIFKLWGNWSDNGIDINSAIKDFLKTVTISPNIGILAHYVPHCLQVSRKCEETAKRIAKNYTFLADKLEPSKMAFKGLIGDSFYLIGGNGKNNENKRDPNPYHEILTYIQMNHMGLKELANGMAMHGVASKMLKIEQEEGRFKDIFPPKQNISLDILIGIDILCDRDYLPDTHGSYEDSLRFRIEGKNGIRKRRAPQHPLIVAIDNGGKEKLLNVLDRIRRMETGEMSQEEIKSLYEE